MIWLLDRCSAGVDYGLETGNVPVLCFSLLAWYGALLTFSLFEGST